jgi:EAL domain-containing protein (putative c-di-GMP-specific phosphodiesterase class I)
VEDVDSLRYLAGEGCDLVQGYHVSRPLAPDAFADWLAQSSAPLHRVS